MALYDYDPRESSPNIDVEVRARVASPWLTARPPASPRMAALGRGTRPPCFSGGVCMCSNWCEGVGPEETGKGHRGFAASLVAAAVQGPVREAGRRHQPTSALGDSPECLLEEN